MRSRWLWRVVVGLGLPLAGACERSGAELSERLRTRLDEARSPAELLVRGESLCATEGLLRFYERRGYQPAWIGDVGPRPEAVELVRFLKGVGREGLRPADYHLESIEIALEESRGAADFSAQLDLELLLSDAFLTCAAPLSRGRVNRESLRPECPSDDVELVRALEVGLSSESVARALQGLIPSEPGYLRLRDALPHYRWLAENAAWNLLPEGGKLGKGSRGPTVGALRSRLAAKANLPVDSAGTEDFDGQLEQSVRSFQKRHGLDVDGAVGRATREALNVSAARRARQIELNLERWRSLPRDLGRRYILVNTPAFELQVLEGERQVVAMKVIVGRPDWPTRDFSGEMTYLVLNPSWHIPTKIAIEEMLPLIRKDPDYLTREGIAVYPSWSEEGEPLDLRRINWNGLGSERFPYMLHQEPGPRNPLGRVKFMLSGSFDVYLHDTPARSLFERAERTFSHGCIRLEKALDLLEYVLRDDQEWTSQRLCAALAEGREQVVRLPEPIPVHLIYRTAWVGDDGAIQFRKDIYGLDERLERAMDLPLGTPSS